MIIGNSNFDVEHETYVMGILNITPDSFSDGGSFNSMDKALRHVEEMVEEGADIIDIGGESTHPGYTRITDEEEIGRIVPVIEAVTERFDIPISVDTYKNGVAEAAIQAGAHLINDIWGFKADEKMAALVARTGVACCLMHNRNQPDYTDFYRDFLCDMRECVDLAKKAGVADDKIILDPGVGFGKTYEHNLQIINHVDILKELGYPVLLGTSRKSVIGMALDLPSDERLEGTLATTVLGVWKSCAFVRVHDVKENKRAITMTKKIMES